MSKDHCKIVSNNHNTWQEYNSGGVVDTQNASAVSFVNTGTNTAFVNGFPLAPGQCVSFGAQSECSLDCTKYNLLFPKTASTKNSIFVFIGESAITFSNILSAAAPGAHTKVDIFDSGGNTLKSTAFQLWVVDSGAITAINSFAAANHTDLGLILTKLTTFATTTQTQLTTVNSNLVTIDNDINKIKSINVDYFPQPANTYYYKSVAGDFAALTTIFPGATIGAGLIARFVYNAGSGRVANAESSTIISDNSINAIYMRATSYGDKFFENWILNNGYIYLGASDECTIEVYNISDLKV